MESSIAPIILFVYNRKDHTRKVLESLSKNDLVDQSILYVFSDGPRSEKDLKKVIEVRELASQVTFCKNVVLRFSESNLGLGASILKGVSEVINEHGKVIVLEDDLVLSPYFLKYMNDALDYYQDQNKIMHISSYLPFTNSVNIQEQTFFTRYMSCWGWATWKDRWSQLDLDVDKHLKNLENRKMRHQFNLDETYNFAQQLIDNKSGKIKSWAIFWFSTIFFKEGLCLCPSSSMTSNVGFDDSGTHCTFTNEFDVSLSTTQIRIDCISLVESKKARIYLKRFYLYGNKSLLHQRILFRINNQINKLLRFFRN